MMTASDEAYCLPSRMLQPQLESLFESQSNPSLSHPHRGTEYATSYARLSISGTFFVIGRHLQLEPGLPAALIELTSWLGRLARAAKEAVKAWLRLMAVSR